MLTLSKFLTCETLLFHFHIVEILHHGLMLYHIILYVVSLVFSLEFHVAEIVGYVQHYRRHGYMDPLPVLEILAF